MQTTLHPHPKCSGSTSCFSVDMISFHFTGTTQHYVFPFNEVMHSSSHLCVLFCFILLFWLGAIVNPDIHLIGWNISPRDLRDVNISRSVRGLLILQFERRQMEKKHWD